MYDPKTETLKVEIPDEIGRVLTQAKRYKILYGGRGGAKSWAIARMLLAMGIQQSLRILCTREIQKSIQDSVHKLLCDQISAMGIEAQYEIQKTCIKGRFNDTEFLFAGLRHNISSLKSYEGVDIVWAEEAQSVSKSSWDVLVPTIRKPGSEIWVSFNPDLEDDETYQRFVVTPPTDSVVVKVNYDSNPWFPSVLEQERKDLERRDYKAYKNVWLGECKQAIEGAIFADEINKASEEQRITSVKIQSGVPVSTYWDLGESDNTAIWFVQFVGNEYRLVDYYQASGHKMAHYIDVLARKKYYYGNHVLPHDADYELLAASSTIKEQLEEAIRNNPQLGSGVKIVERVAKKHLAIEAARSVFANCIFDKENTKDGLQCLRHSRYAKDNETGKISKEPVHDIWSHGADAFMTMAQYAQPPRKAQRQQLTNLARFR